MKIEHAFTNISIIQITQQVIVGRVHTGCTHSAAHKQLSISGGRGREGQHTVCVHLHHDHRDSLMADPDDPGPRRSLSRLLIGRGSLWGVGLSLTWLIRLAGGLGGRGLSFHAGSHRGTQVHLRADAEESTQISRLVGKRAGRTFNGADSTLD